MSAFHSLSLCGLFLLLSAFFSAGETALLSLPHQELKRLAIRIPTLEKHIALWLSKPEKMIITVLMINTLVDVAFASSLTLLMFHLLSFWPQKLIHATAWITGGTVTTLIGEIFPKFLGRRHPELISRLTLPLIATGGFLFKPLLFILEKALNPFLKTKTPGSSHRDLGFSTDELLHVLVDSGKGLEISSECLDMMKRTIEIHKKVARDIMIPKDKVESIDWDRVEKEEDLIFDLFIESGHTRVPVTKGGSFVGYLHAQDILENALRSKEPLVFKSLIRRLPVTTDERPIGELLTEFEERGVSIALVQNASQETLGLITMVDLLEEITGEILDEYDLAEKAHLLKHTKRKQTP